MEISGKFYDLVALLPRKDPHVFTEQKIGWASESMRTVWKRGKSSLPLQGIEP
jgi:hypothetical protein